MPRFRIALLGVLALITALASGSKCPQGTTSKFVVCYYKGEISLGNFNVCNCTHLVFANGARRLENNSLTLSEDAKKDLAIVKERKSDLLTLFTLETKPEESSAILKSDNRSEELVNELVDFLREAHFDGVELDFRFAADDGVLKESYGAFVKDLSKALPSRHPRVKREGYDVFEKLQDDVTTAAYPTQTPKNGTHKAEAVGQRNGKKEKGSRKTRNEKEDVTQEPLEEAINREFSKVEPETQTNLKDLEDGTSSEEDKFLIFVRLSIQPEVIAKKFDLKTISRYADVLTVPTHDIVNKNENGLTYHPSRLMGLADILNTDSILDFLTGMGASKPKIVISFPATVLRFQLKDSSRNTPRSPSVSKPQIIDQSQMCGLFAKSNWTIERDDDLTAPYAFSGKTWLAFEDEISVNIKGKYILLRELAGGAIYPIDADDSERRCANNTGSGGYLTGILSKNFRKLERKPRALVLESLQEEIHDTGFQSIEAGVKLSEYRIVRVVDHSGAVHVIRKNTKTQFECSRQGYFSHPLGCNKFYRCVKFDQYSDEFTVFEYDCPAGLAFDERWEVCVWPGSLPHGAPCTGSSEIAPVPRSHYRCPNREGYYADPENCRWFFACLDHARDGVTPLTAYEFRCPFGLVFNEERLACDWPWLVGACGNRGAAGFLQVKAGAQSQGVYSATFVNGGNLAASSGQFGNTEEELAFDNFGKGFGSVLKATDTYTAKGSYPAQSAGFGYIASQFEDNNDRAAFASFPDYEISGGRIPNKGGVVLNEHVNVGGASGAAVGGAAGFGFQHNIQSTVGGGHVLPEIELQRLTPAPGVAKSTVVQSGGFSTAAPGLANAVTVQAGGVSGGGHVSFQSPISTPKPFSVHIPSVQINEEKISGFSAHSNVQPTTPQSVLVTEQGSVQNGGAFFGTSTVSLDALATPKPQVHRFGTTGFKQADLPGRISVTPSPFPATVTKSFQGTSLGAGSVTVGEPVSAGLPFVTPKPGVQSFEYTAGGHGAGVGLGVSQPSVSLGSPVVGFTKQTQSFAGQGNVFGQSVSVGIPAVTPAVESHVFESTNSGQGSVSGSVGVTQSTASYGVPLVSSYSSAQSGGSGSVLTVTPKPILHNLQQTSVDRDVFNELTFNTPVSSFKLASVTPKTEFSSFSHSSAGGITEQLDVKVPAIPPVPQKAEVDAFSTQFGAKSFGGASGGKSTVSFVTPKTDANTFGYFGGLAGGASVTPVPPLVTPTFKNAFEQTGARETFSKVSFGVSPVVPKSEFQTFGQKFSGFQSSQGVFPAVTPAPNTQGIAHSGGVSPGFVKSEVEISNIAPVQPVLGQQFSYSTSFKDSGSQFSSIAPFSQTPKPVFNQQEVLLPKAEKAKTITHVSIEQQPILSVGTITSVGFDQGASTPKTYTQSSGAGFNFKSTYFQPKGQVSVTTPTPVVSITPPAPTPHQPTPVNFLGKAQGVSLQSEVSVPAVPGTFEHKSFSFGGNFNQEVKSFGPGVQVTTPRPFAHQEELVPGITSKSGFFEQSNVFVPPVTQKVEIFGPKFQQTSQFGSAGKQEVVIQQPHQSFEFVKSRPLIEITEQKVQQVPVRVTTPGPEFKSVLNTVSVTTGKPFSSEEGLLDISKSVELNPSQFFQSTNRYVPSQSTTPSPVVIQQQPVRLLSQKTFTDAGVVQPFFHQSQKDVVQGQINAIPETGYQDRFAFHKQQELHEQKQYLAPAVTPKTFGSSIRYSTTKSTVVDQPVYSVTPAIQTAQVAFTGQKGTLLTDVQTGDLLPAVGVAQNPPSSVFAGQPVVQGVTPKANLLLPYTEDVTVQQHNSFDFQKVNSFKGAQNVFIQPEAFTTSTPAANVFRTSGQFLQQSTQNVTSGSGHSLFGSGVKYAINPKIAIPEPPKEYLLGQNLYTTVAPEFSTRQQQVLSTTTASDAGRFKSTAAYLPPTAASRRRPSAKATVISVGNIDEQEVHDDNIQQILEKYSGRFGEVIGGDKDKFVTKVVSGSGRGEIELGRLGSSTVQYEVSSTTPRPRSRGRQYHGGITSGIQATNKYEEYEIESDRDAQRSFAGDASKATIDLKNLKLDKNKKTVIVVSQVSDANPILVGKLAGQCSCQSNMLELRNKGKKSGSGKNNGQRPPVIYNEFLPPFREAKESNIVTEVDPQGGLPAAAEVTPETVLIGGRRASTQRASYAGEHDVASSTTPYPEVSPSTILSSLGPNGVLPITPKSLYSEERLKNRKKQFRGRTRYLPPVSLFGGKSDEGSAPFSLVPASEIASTVDYQVLRGDESRTQNEIDGGRAGGPKALAGAAYERYGPGGWRSFDETLQGSVDCQRPGLFRHPKYCNKFYACNYDPWKEKYTLHVFNCPIHLTYDSSISACNWPVRGPACADDNLLV